MTDTGQYDLNYRPQTYWDDALGILLSNIKGEHRRRRVLELVREGRIDAIEQFLLAEKLPDPVRELVGKIHPVFMGGEYLPDCEEKEVEIARVSLQSTTADVISIRAKQGPEGIKYRIADEYESVFKFVPETSSEPLTLRELIGLIDSVEYEDSQGHKGLTNSFRDLNFAADTSEDAAQRAQELVDFVSVTSNVYTELERWYRDEAYSWLKDQTQDATAARQSHLSTEQATLRFENLSDPDGARK
jgi:hypothetical protein